MNFNSLTNTEIAKECNSLVQEWAGQFENPPQKLPLVFTVNESGMLCGNGTVLFFAKQLAPDSLEYDFEEISLSSVTGDRFVFGIQWSFENEIYVSFIKKITTIFQAP